MVSRYVRLGEYRVDFATWEVSRNGHRERLREKPFRVLEALTERSGELITRSELQQRLWPDGTVVDFDNNLNTAVASLRTVFGDTAKAPWLIETLPRLGYRLIAEAGFEESASFEDATGLQGSEQTEAASGDPGDASRPRAPETTVARPTGNSTTPRRFSSRWPAIVGVLACLALAIGARQVLRSPVVDSDSLGSGPRWHQSAVPEDPEARQAWQRGHYLLARGSAGDLTQALTSFEEAGDRDPRFAPIHAAMAETLVRMSFSGGLELRDGLTRAREAAGRALTLDPRSADGHRILALAELHLGWDFEAAGAGIESALRLAPENAPVHLAAATFLAAAGANEAAVRAARRAVELDPASTLLRADLGFFLLAAGRYSEALVLSEELLELEPESIHVLGSLQIAAERLGLYDRSLAAAQRVMELRGADEAEVRALDGGDARASLIHFRRWRLETFRASGEPSFFRLAVYQAALQQKEPTLASLRRAHEQHDPWMVYLHAFAAFAELRDDPEFRAFVDQLGFPAPSDPVIERVAERL